MIREALAGFHESLVGRAKDLDITEPARAYVHLQTMVGLYGKPTSDGMTMQVKNPVGDIVAVTLDKNGGLYDLIAVHKDGKKRRLDAESFLEPEKVAELQALWTEFAGHEEA